MSEADRNGKATPPGGQADNAGRTRELAQLNVPVDLVFQHLSDRGIAEWNAAVDKARNWLLAEHLVKAEALLEQMPQLAAAVEHVSPPEANGPPIVPSPSVAAGAPPE